MGLGELKTDAEASLLCYFTSLCLAQTQPRKRKLYGEGLPEPSTQDTYKVPRVETPQVFIVEDFWDPSGSPSNNSKPQHIPKAIPGELMEQVELVVGEASKKISIGTGLEDPLKQNLINLLRQYSDIFT